jgi:hypothetical protein
MEKCLTYDAAFKRKVVLCAEKKGNYAAGRECTVSEACVCHWQSVQTKLFSYLRNSRFLDEGKGEILRLMPLF